MRSTQCKGCDNSEKEKGVFICKVANTRTARIKECNLDGINHPDTRLKDDPDAAVVKTEVSRLLDMFENYIRPRRYGETYVQVMRKQILRALSENRIEVLISSEPEDLYDAMVRSGCASDTKTYRCECVRALKVFREFMKSDSAPVVLDLCR